MRNTSGTETFPAGRTSHRDAVENRTQRQTVPPSPRKEDYIAFKDRVTLILSAVASAMTRSTLVGWGALKGNQVTIVGVSRDLTAYLLDGNSNASGIPRLPAGMVRSQDDATAALLEAQLQIVRAQIAAPPPMGAVSVPVTS